MMILFEKPASSGISFWSILGRKILSKSGEFSGRIYSISVRGRELQGFFVFYKFNIFLIDQKFIQNFEIMDRKSAMLLNIDPIYLLAGRFVYDHDGRKLGKVVRVDQIQKSNDYEAIGVRKRIFSRVIRIERERIDKSKKNIILKNIT